MFKPKALKLGDTIGIIAPSSPADIDKVYKAKSYINNMGFKVKLGKSCFETWGYLSGDDSIRAEDLDNMFADKEVDGILCLRGGYGASRILDKINFNIVKENPKIFVGYSDITVLHTAFNQICNLVTFHGPMAASNMSDEIDQFTIDSFLKAISSTDPLGNIENPINEKIGCLVPGEACGQIIGGNLALIAGTLGTPYEINTKGKLLLIEEVEEEPYRVDRMLIQLALAGKLENAKGIILGDFKNCTPKEYVNSLSLMEVFQSTIVPFNKPTIYNLKAGHSFQKITIPFGVEAKLVSDEGKLTILERAAL
ncbi:S66 peptidase family protein [Serpentinicella alkaliphila]|uniref:Muramoyltetrapeptide carboxypeptidase n=1 Tax=Serpentinicella alkaliphila TaxID=1734049 RepID=A0A4R2TCI0_9FIRM|nr:LD-carboxypeptidase [Serpentinicella alkaliphila]QUH25505.1 LD-carboxypeptidase [Serpentinicella alkaliphila]TCP99691.1 muramoyltetrapeptide carboxypeptidase [Serpentinicella alkaliphila]